MTRKVSWFVVGLIAVAAAVALWWRLARSDGEGPHLARGLSAEQTAGLIGIEGLPAFIKQIDAALGALPSDTLKPHLPFLDPTARTALLGFDPREPAGWATVGIDADHGVIVDLDARLHIDREGSRTPVPVVIAKVTDRDKLAAFIGRFDDSTIRFVTRSPTVETVSLGSSSALWGRMGEYSAIALLADAKAADDPDLVARFETLLATQSSRLADDPNHQRAFADRPDPIGTYAYVRASALAALISTVVPSARSSKGSGAFYAEKFPAIAAHLGTEVAAARLVASESGGRVLRQLFRPTGGSPSFARYLPARGWAGVRFSVNVPQILDGALALLPPAVPSDTRMQLGMGKAMLPMIIGVSWDDIAAAFAGHFVVAMDLSTLPTAMSKGPRAVEWLAMATVRDAQKIDAVLPPLLDRLSAIGGAVEPATIAGQAGYLVKLGMTGEMVLVARPDVVLIGPRAASVEAAVKRSTGDNLEGKPTGKPLDDDVIFAMVADLSMILELAAQRPELKSMNIEALRAQPDITISARLDADGIVLRAPAHLATLAVAMVPMTVLPAVVKMVDGSPPDPTANLPNVP